MLQQSLKALCVFIAILGLVAANNSPVDSYCPPNKTNGEYTIKPVNSTIPPFPVYCEYGPYGTNTGSIVIERTFKGSLNTEHNDCAEVRTGYGSLEGEFALGLEKVHQITRTGKYALTVVLKIEDGTEIPLQYRSFSVGSEQEQYVQRWGRFLGNKAGDDGDFSKFFNGLKFDPQQQHCFDRNVDSVEEDSEDTVKLSDVRLMIRKVL